jgi:hypothetical protein
MTHSFLRSRNLCLYAAVDLLDRRRLSALGHRCLPANGSSRSANGVTVTEHGAAQKESDGQALCMTSERSQQGQINTWPWSRERPAELRGVVEAIP